MNRNRLILIGVLALAVAAYVTYALYRVARDMTSAGRVKTTDVVVATASLVPGATIAAADLRVTKLPAAELPEGTFADPSQLVGRGVLEAMAPNELVLSRKVALPEAGSGLPAMIPTGMRAVSVKVNDVVSVAGFVLPGTHVDVILTGYPDKDRDPQRVTTTTVLENVLVLAAGPKLNSPKNGEPQTEPVITLLVSPEDAQKLTLASSEGKIQLSLRSPLDSEKENPALLRNGTLYQIAAPPPPKRRAAAPKIAAAPPPPEPARFEVETIRGTNRDVVTLQ